MSEEIAYGVELRGNKAGSWRGVIDIAETKAGALGLYVSGQRIWRCPHEHRSAGAAQTCARRQLSCRAGSLHEVR